MSYNCELALALTRKGREVLKESLTTLGNTGEARTIKAMFRHPDVGRVAKNGAKLWWWEHVDAESPEMTFIDSLERRLELPDYLRVSIGEYIDDTAIDGMYLANPFGLTVSRKIVAA